MRRVFFAASCLALTACGDEAVAPVAEVVLEPCGNDVPLITWENFGKGFLTTYCQGCHASTSPNRQGAPENVIFDTEDDALRVAGLVLDAAASEQPRMPPNGGPGAADRERLEIWLTCFVE